MAKKRQSKSKRSLGSLPKGLPLRKGGKSSLGDINPFEITTKQKRPKYEVHNRPVSKPKSKEQTLESLQRRRTQLRSTLNEGKKVNVFVDRRIGQYDNTMTQEDKMLARLVKERTRRSQRTAKFQLGDDDDDDDADVDDSGLTLTHKGKPLNPADMKSAAFLGSDDEDDDKGNLAAVDTELHFGGAGITEMDQYGSSSNNDLSRVYSQRKTELDDLIARRKVMKAEKMQNKETQLDYVEKMDEGFAELSQLLRYRKNEVKPASKDRTQEDEDMKDWHTDIKEMMSKPKKKATDRTKTPEESAKEESERLHELETKRMARMNGDFEDDDLSDISVDQGRSKKKSKKQKKSSAMRNPDELSDSEDENDMSDKLEARFTADGLVYINQKGEIVKKLGEEEEAKPKQKEDPESSGDEGDENDDDDDESTSSQEVPSSTKHPLSVGTAVRANYRADEQFDGQSAWHEGKITHVHVLPDGSFKYDVDYDDGDFEEEIKPDNIEPREATETEKSKDDAKKLGMEVLQMKQKKARQQARSSIPFVFEVPTTLEALHEMIGKYAETGEDASMIIQRIHGANSVRLDRRNKEKMQNFYDVLLRRFVAVGDAIFEHGDGSQELGRYQQLTALTRVMYDMAQDSPESAGAVWNRRVGFLQNAHAKRLRDAEFVSKNEEDDQDDDDNDEDDAFITAWPSSGTIFLLRALGHMFPVTDLRHHVVTPALLLLGQMISHTPVLSLYDVVMGIMCSGLLLEYTKQAKRVSTEAIGFLSDVIRLFLKDEGNLSAPSLNAAKQLPSFQNLSQRIEAGVLGKKTTIPKLSLEKSRIMGGDDIVWASALTSSLDLIQKAVSHLGGELPLNSEQELFAQVSESLLSLSRINLPKALRKKVKSVASSLAEVCPSTRAPLVRRPKNAVQDDAIKTLAPRMEDPDKYSLSKDKGKKSVQAAIDRTRREYKREHKAISRELRLDAAFIETERRRDADKRDSKARAKRQKNFAWMEGEQAIMNQQVRQGGGLLTGGGTGLARAKVATGKMGVKKGGKF